MPKLRHYDDIQSPRFITFNCYRDRPYLELAQAKSISIEEIQAARNKFGFKLLAYVIMPEHVHLVVFPAIGNKIGPIIREIKSRTARRYFANDKSVIGEERVFWTKRCYDHNCRNRRLTISKIKYCHRNPVRRGLVRRPEEYKWSSFTWYLGNHNGPLAVDEDFIV